MKAFWAKITAFFMAIIAFFTGLFAGGNKPDPQPQPEPTSQVMVMPTELTTEPEPPTSPDVPAPVIIYQAHRGFSSAYPENTLAAFRAAGENGFGCIELDPAVTKDGQVVVMHDRTVNRTCRNPDGSALAAAAAVSDMTFEELRLLDAGLSMGEAFRGERIPLLTGALSLAREYGMKVKIDNKVEGFSAAERALVFAAVAGFEDTAEFTAKTLAYARTVLERFPASSLHYDGPVTEEILAQLAEVCPKERLTVWLPLDTPGTAWNTLPKADAESCALVKHYARLGLWILTLPEELETARGFGADIIETPGDLLPPSAAAATAC